MTEQKPKDKWYYKTYTLIVGFLMAGPLVLPLVWKNPRFSKKAKTLSTIVILILTYFLTVFMIGSLKSIRQYYQLMY